MFSYINQSCTPSFKTGLVKNKSDFIVRSIETGIVRWALMVPVIIINVYSFLAFSDLTYQKKYWGSFPYSYFRWCGYVWGPWMSFAMTWVLREGDKNYFKDWCFMTYCLPFYFLTNFKSMNYGHIIKST